jgi:hypothetical protein
LSAPLPVAALLLDNLHKQNLAALDDFLDFILLAMTVRTMRHFFIASPPSCSISAASSSSSSPVRSPPRSELRRSQARLDDRRALATKAVSMAGCSGSGPRSETSGQRHRRFGGRLESRFNGAICRRGVSRLLAPNLHIRTPVVPHIIYIGFRELFLLAGLAFCFA